MFYQMKDDFARSFGIAIMVIAAILSGNGGLTWLYGNSLLGIKTCPEDTVRRGNADESAGNYRR